MTSIPKVRVGQTDWNPGSDLRPANAAAAKVLGRRYAPVPSAIEDIPDERLRAEHLKYIGGAIGSGYVPSYRGMLSHNPIGVINLMDELVRNGALNALQEAVGSKATIKPATAKDFGGELARED